MESNPKATLALAAPTLGCRQPSAAAARPHRCRSIISRTDIFQRALAAKAEGADFYAEMAAYGEDYLGEAGAGQVGGLAGCLAGSVAGFLAAWLAAWLAAPASAPLRGCPMLQAG